MGLLDRIFVGEVIRDFGELDTKNLGIGRSKISALLARRRGKLRFVIKQSAATFFGGSLSYLEIPAESLPRLREMVEEARQLSQSMPIG